MARPTSGVEATLHALIGAFNRHDLDAVMEHVADDCVLFMPTGVGPRGVGLLEFRDGEVVRKDSFWKILAEG